MNTQTVVSLKKRSASELNIGEISSLIDEISIISHLLSLAAPGHLSQKTIQYVADSISSKCECIKRRIE